MPEDGKPDPLTTTLPCPHCGAPLTVSLELMNAGRTRFRCSACGGASHFPFKARFTSFLAILVVLIVAVLLAKGLGLDRPSSFAELAILVAILAAGVFVAIRAGRRTSHPLATHLVKVGRRR